MSDDEYHCDTCDNNGTTSLQAENTKEDAADQLREVLSQLANSHGRLSDAVITTNGGYNHYDRVVGDYKDCMRHTESLYRETLKTIERIGSEAAVRKLEGGE